MHSMLKHALFAFVLLSSSAVIAKPFGDADKGKHKSPSCIYCHGVTGISNNDSYPHLAGQNAKYLYDSMKAYKDGLRRGPLADMMAAQLRMLNDDDLRDVAAFYAQQSPQAKD